LEVAYFVFVSVLNVCVIFSLLVKLSEIKYEPSTEYKPGGNEMVDERGCVFGVPVCESKLKFNNSP
jgi:hypothetical protein